MKPVKPQRNSAILGYFDWWVDSLSWFSELIQSTWLVVGLYSDEILLARVNLGMDQFESSKELRQFFTRKFFFCSFL